MGRYDRLLKSSPTPKEHEVSESAKQPGNTEANQTTNKPINQSINQSIDQSINQAIDHQTSKKSKKIVDKARGFYITEDLDIMLDNAVRYFREKHGIKKADRSTILNALLDKEELFTPEELDKSLDKLIELLTHRLIG